MAESALKSIPGGQQLIDWFGFVPDFHDAELFEITLSSKGESTLRVHTWKMTDKTDDKGYYILDKHVTVTIRLEAVRRVDLLHFHLQGIISRMNITAVKRGLEFTWGGSYGVEGTICAERAHIDILPGKRDHLT